MPAQFDLVTFDGLETDRLAAFWSSALDLHEVEREDAGRWIVLADGDGRRRIGLQRGTPRPGGVHLDLVCPLAEHEQETRRLTSIGARLLEPVRLEPYGAIANLADPEGNPFDLCAYR